MNGARRSKRRKGVEVLFTDGPALDDAEAMRFEVGGEFVQPGKAVTVQVVPEAALTRRRPSSLSLRGADQA